jgi:dTDP-4-amino-4,6-dideoxygalactose transaminase
MDEFYVSWVPKKSINTNRVNDLLKICLETGTFSNYGPNVQMLENIIRDKFKVDDSKAVIVVANGSVALHILTSAIDFKKTFKWATQSFTFPPSAQANLSNAQIIDVDENGGINLNDIDESINGFIVTNVFGSIVDIDKYVNYAKKFNKILVFDNASTMYTFYKGKNCINYGTGCAVSFHHTKPFGFGEGGAIIIDKIYENNARKLINFGMNLTDEYYVPEGNNSKMSEISAIYLIQ